MPNFLKCPCGKSIDEILEQMIKSNKICPSHKLAKSDMDKKLDDHQYIFDCYKFNRDQFKKKYGLQVTNPDPREIICDYRYILFEDEMEANRFYRECTYDVGLRSISSKRLDQYNRNLWLVRFIDKVKSLVVNNISGFIEHDTLIMMAGALSSYIGISTSILPKINGERALSNTKDSWNGFCKLLSNIDTAQKYCTDCTRGVNNFIKNQKNHNSKLKKQEPQIYKIEEWCGFSQIVIPILINGRWVATSVTGGLWNKDFSFDKFLRNLKTENIYDKFLKDLTSLGVEHWELKDGSNPGTSNAERLKTLEKIFEGVQNSPRFNPPTLDGYKKIAKIAVLNIQDTLEERYASIRRMKNEYWLQRLVLAWENRHIDPSHFGEEVYKNFIKKMEEYGQFEQSYFLLNKRGSKNHKTKRRTFHIYSGLEGNKEYILPDDYQSKGKFFNEPIKIYHLASYNNSDRLPEDEEEYILSENIRQYLLENEEELPDHCAIMPLVISKEDHRFGIAVFVGRKNPKPQYIDQISEYIRALLLGFRRSFLDRVKISYEEIKQADNYEAQKTFLDFLNHEIALTLSYWNGSLQWIERQLTQKFGKFETEKIQLRIKDQREQAFQLNRLISDLALINILNEGELRIHPEVVDIFELIKTATHLYAGNALRKKINFNFGIKLSVEASLDKAYMERVFGNLVRNAIQYAYSSTSIIFNRYNIGDSIFFTITNYGIKVEREYEEKIFERGFRSPNAQEYCTGTGYGLWLSREILRAHGKGFDLYYNRSRDSGNESTFIIKIPIKQIF